MIPEAVAKAIERRVTPDEIRDAVEGPIAPEEREDVLSLVRWFTTRYASPEDRLAYIRRAYRRWRRTSG